MSANHVLVINQGDALVAVTWTTAVDITHSQESYTAFVQPIVNGQALGLENCATFGPF